MKHSPPVLRFIWIMVLTGICALIAMPKELPVNIKVGNVQVVNMTLQRPPLDLSFIKIPFKRDLELKKGLDIQGGSRIVLEADMSKLPEKDRVTALQSAQSVVNRRVDLYGVSESTVKTSQTGETYRIIVELPGVTDADQAVQVIGTTAQLDFREEDPTKQVPAQATNSADLLQLYSGFKRTTLSGKDLQRALVEFDRQTGKPTVRLEFNNEGKMKFAELTTRNVGKRIAIFLDEFPITIPTVNTPIQDGTAIISGGFTIDAAKELSVQLNGGALPVPLTVIQQETIEASLGENAVQQTYRAGLIGLVVVAAFMILCYGLKGVLAVAALLVYTLITIAIYKLTPITLTLPGIAGLLLSIGMAVDSNILIFERMKEELRWGRPFEQAMELGFGRAWNSIKDANIATLFTSFILFNPFDFDFLNRSGLVRGFALTLALGIGVGLFTGLVVTRTFLRLFLKETHPVVSKEGARQ